MENKGRGWVTQKPRGSELALAQQAGPLGDSELRVRTRGQDTATNPCCRRVARGHEGTDRPSFTK